MIFIVIILFVIIAITALNFYDNSNITKLENYIKTQNCIESNYSRGYYKAICPKKILKLENSFTINIQKNKKEILYDNIRSIKHKNNIIYINKEKFEFKKDENAKRFYKILQDKLSNDRNS
ncbi:hypothetical protein [Arcobacter sp. CECT 8985]|uniref:hypothetical protein n=1 Tax=Arcobacter sp. CECT 8985 TaxID=1935424 RepID=UPI00100B5764|nr:hypothetical protein [Arcobacter sp. CECT 8985]RXJ86191.1 hypothetical protein CRU93_09550 [Arcobacter sp. CECT 8985]